MNRQSEAAGSLMFTVCTSTFDRADTLPRVYEGLKQQTFRSFEWLVMDDGSTDGTRDLVHSWVNEAPFPIRYFYQPNSGKHVSENRAAGFARGTFITVLDSDDSYLPTALETFASAWESIEPSEREEFVGIVALCADQEGSLIGDPFPSDLLDTTYTELRSKHRVAGDKAGCARIDVVRRFPFPVFEGERRPIEGLVYRRIAREYRCRCVNQIVKIVEYQPDGLSASGRRLWITSARTAKLYFLESLTDGDLGAGPRVRNYANHLRFALHAGLGRQSWIDSPSKFSWLVTAPLGTLLYLRDRVLERLL
jgi:glycosyltransferase involved in cell wall biosynthesis